MTALAGFVRGLLSMKAYWIAWVAVLLAVNGAAPLFFLDTIEGQVVLGLALAGMVIQLVIFQARGFVRLLGLGHFSWLAMLPWLALRLDGATEGGALATWIVAVLAVNGASLLIDIADVVRYLRGERAPIV